MNAHRGNHMDKKKVLGGDRRAYSVPLVVLGTVDTLAPQNNWALHTCMRDMRPSTVHGQYIDGCCKNSKCRRTAGTVKVKAPRIFYVCVFLGGKAFIVGTADGG